MFEYKTFRGLIDKTTKLIEEIKTADKDEQEELEVKIESNIYALKQMADKIEDQETKHDFLQIINSLKNGVNMRELEDKIVENKRKTSQGSNKVLGDEHKSTEVIDNELLKNTLLLKKMAEDFNVSLKNDSKVIERLNLKMGEQTIQSENNIKKLERQSSEISSSFFLFISVMVFFFVYFIIRFL